MAEKFIIRQQGQVYSIFHPQVGLICQVWLGNDQQYMKDAQCMAAIGRALQKRWNMSD